MRQILETIDRLLVEGRYDLPSPTVTAYHCGRKLEGGKFDLKYAGSGEGMQALGPGMYFATKRSVAELYCDIPQEPVMYTVEIPTDKLYYATQGVPKRFREPLRELYSKIAKKRGEWNERWGEYRLPNARTLTYGPGSVGELFQALGARETIKRLGEVGIDGLYEPLGGGGGGGFEIAVYDPSIIRIVDASPATSQD